MSEPNTTDLSRRVAEAAGYVISEAKGVSIMEIAQRPDSEFHAAPNTLYEVPPFATSLDAIAAEEKRAGYKVDIIAHSDGSYQALGRNGHNGFSANSECIARCKAYLAAKGVTP